MAGDEETETSKFCPSGFREAGTVVYVTLIRGPKQRHHYVFTVSIYTLYMNRLGMVWFITTEQRRLTFLVTQEAMVFYPGLFFFLRHRILFTNSLHFANGISSVPGGWDVFLET